MFGGKSPATEQFFLRSQLASCTKKMLLVPINYQIYETTNKIVTLRKLGLCPLTRREGGKNEVSSKPCSQKSFEIETSIKFCQWIMLPKILNHQFYLCGTYNLGHGKLYIESLGLSSSTPLESLCDLMLNN